MGGKTGTTTSSVSIPPEVLARYNSVNAQAQTAAGTPFQQYSSDPNAFVAPLNQQQQEGIGNINQQANAAQPGFQGAMADTNQAYQGFNAPNYQQGVAGYMNPYLQNAMGSTAAMMQNQNQQQQNQLLGNTIQQGAFGGDRGNIAQAALMGQQNLAMGQTLGQMANQGYQQSAQNYMTGLQQQGTLANQYGNLAGAAQTAGLQGAQAQLGAGTLGQQTQQAGNTALYNQFQQQQAYPFQVAQFLANIAEGTGALSGSTTTQTSPTSFFSDRRLKHDIHRIGETDEGLPIYKFKYKGDDKTNIGFMADEVEKIHPEAVGESHGFKTVDYDRAARYAGGLVGNSEGGMVTSMHEKEGFFQGGDVVSPIDLSAILASQQQSYAPFQQGGLYGATSGGMPGGKSYVPATNLPVSHLAVASPIKQQQGETLAGDVHSVADMGADVSKLNQYRKDIMGQKAKAAVPATDNTPAQPAQPATGLEWVKEYFGGNQPQGQYRGGLVHAYADGGDVQPYGQNDPMSDVVKGGEKKPAELKLMQSQPNMGGQGSSTFGDLSKLASIGSDISTLGTMASNILPFFGMNAGGRAGYEDGGSPEGDDVVGSMGPQLPNNSNYYKARAVEIAKNAGINPVDFVKLGQGESGFVPHSGDDNSSAGVMQNHIGGASSQFPNGGRGDEFIAKYAPDEIKNGTPEQKIAYLNARETQIPQMQDAAEYIKTHGAQPWTVAKQQGLFGATREADMPVKGGLNAQAATGQQGFAAPNDEQPKTLGDTLTSENTLIPLLSGLGAMAGSKSRYLGSAILEGIGAGAKSYEDVQANIASRGLTGAETSVQNAAAAEAIQQMSQRDFITISGTPMVQMPGGRTITKGQWIKMGAPPTRSMVEGYGATQPAGGQQNISAGDGTTVPSVTPNTPAQPVGPIEPAGLGGGAKKYIDNDFNALSAGGADFQREQRAMSSQTEADVYNRAQAAAAATRESFYLARHIATQPDSGFNTAGPLNPITSYAIAKYNNLTQGLGLPQLSVNQADIDNNYVLNKINNAIGLAQSNSQQQHNLQGLQAALASIPGPAMPKGAALEIIGKNLVDSQIPLDQMQYLNKYKQNSFEQTGLPDQYLAHNAINAFREDHPQTEYSEIGQKVGNFMKAIDTRTGQPIFTEFLNGQIPIEWAEKKFGKGIVRFLKAQ